MPPSSARQFLITVSTIEGYWARKQGGETAADSAKAWDGGSLTPSVLMGPASTGDVTLERPYRVERDASVVARLRRVVGRSSHTITVQPTDIDLVPVGAPEVYNGVLMRVRSPEPNAAEGGAATVELVFAVESAS